MLPTFNALTDPDDVNDSVNPSPVVTVPWPYACCATIVRPATIGRIRSNKSLAHGVFPPPSEAEVLETKKPLMMQFTDLKTLRKPATRCFTIKESRLGGVRILRADLPIMGQGPPPPRTVQGDSRVAFKPVPWDAAGTLL